jgi:hypothetical protein
MAMKIETAIEFLRRRAGSATGAGLSALLDLVPSAEPLPEDRMPEERQKSAKRTRKPTGL